MLKKITEEQKSLNNEKEFSLDEYRRSMPYWKRVSYSFSSLRWITMQQKKDPYFNELTEQYYKETDPEEKKRIGMAREEYWQNKTDLEYNLRDYENEKTKIQSKIDCVKHQLWINKQLTKGIPAKHILRCEYPGLEFREEIDASEIDCSYKDDYDFYQDALSDYVSDYIPNWMSDQGLNFEKLLDMDGYFKKDKVPSSGHFWYGEIRTEVFGNGGFPINEKIKIYLDSIRKDGSVIETKKIAIEDCFNLESQKEMLMECGFFEATDEYISASLERFIKESTWNVSLRKGDYFILDVKKWPAPGEDGSWIDKDGTELEPFIWFGDAGPDTYNALWNIHPEMAEYYLGFWFSEEPLRYIVEYDYSGHAGCYGGFNPDITPIRENCPILLKKNDTIDTVKEKIQAFFVEQYKKAHLKKRGKKEGSHA